MLLLLILPFTIYFKMIESCQSVKIFSQFSDLLSIFPFQLSPPPPPNPIQIHDPKCGGAEIQIVTNKHWVEGLVQHNMNLINHDIGRLEKYSAISTAEFGQDTRTPVAVNINGVNYFGVNFKMEHFTSTCQRMQLFVRNAVSWSSEIQRATINCRCEPTIHMLRQ